MNKEKDIHSSGKNLTASVAVIGMSCIFPKATNLCDYWTNIKNGIDAITEVPETHWQKDDYFDADPGCPDMSYSARGGFIGPVDFDPLEFGITPNAVEATDTAQLLGLVAAKRALNDAGYGDGKEFNRDKVGVILGVTGTLELVIPLGARLSHPIWKKALKDAGVDDSVTNDVIERISDSYVDWQENSFPGLLGNVAAGRIANRLDLRGTNCVVDAACASSFSAMHMAMLELSTGKSDMVITGGIDTFNDIFMYMCFSKTRVLSPTGDARPFDRNGDGTVLGEGLGMLVLKRLADAERDKDNIYAIIRGIGTSSDGKGSAVYVPSSSGQARALYDAYEQASVSPDTIGLVEAHGTGTKVGDASEVNALTNVYRDSKKNGTWCALGSVKSQIGHTKAAAGIAGLIKTIMALRHKILPPTIKVSAASEALTESETPFYLNTEARPWLQVGDTPRRAAVSAFGFGGSNFHCVLEEHKKAKETIDWDPNIEILSFSDKELNGLKERIKSTAASIPMVNLSVLAADCRASFSHEHTFRLITVIEREKSDVKAALHKALDILEQQPDKESWNLPEGVFYASGNPDRKLGVLFSGQGSQYVGMQRELSCQFPQMQKVLTEANSVFLSNKHNGSFENLTNYIYPIPSFDQADKRKYDDVLKRTENAQPAIGAISIGMLDILNYFGIVPDVLGGHSFGELTALCAASCIDRATFYRLSKLRGELMSENNCSTGSMVAVWSDSETLSDIIKRESVDLVIANKNSPVQTVLSGSTDEVKRIGLILDNLGIKFKELAVSSAFHSPFMEKVADDFNKALQESSFNPHKIPLYANRTGQLYPNETDSICDILTEQIYNPVEFIKQIENMYESGTTTFIEVGPGSKLTGLVGSILADKGHESFSMDASSGKSSGLRDLALTLTRLAVSGFNVDLKKWNEGVAPAKTNPNDRKKKSIILSICGSNYVQPKKRKPARAVASHESRQSNNDVAIEMKKKDQIKKQPALNVNKLADSPVSKEHVMDKGTAKEIFKMTNDNMGVLQKMQEQTAKLHKQFLESQETTLKSLISLMGQQSQLLGVPLEGTQDIKLPAPEKLLSKNSNFSDEPISISIPDGHETIEHAFETAEVTTSTAVENKRTNGENQAKKTNSNQIDNGNGHVSNVLLSVVSEKTGYPPEMLELEMNLESDLGIDSIKRVEILSAIQEKLPDAPDVKPEHMGVLNTLQQIIDFLSVNNETRDIHHSDAVSDNGNDNVRDVLLSVVSEKTGYPPEMLEPEMNLEADLGIDSIKRVEILSALQEKLPDAPDVKPEHMGVLNTLQQIIDFLSVNNETKDIHHVENTASDTGNASIREVLLSVVSEKTGYPPEMLEPEMNLEADLGIDSIKRVEILSAIQEKLPDAPDVKPEHMGVLNTLQQIIDFLSNNKEISKTVEKDGSTISESVEKNGSTNNSRQKIETVGINGNHIARSVLYPFKLNGSSNDKVFTIEKWADIWIADDGSNLAPEIESRLRELYYNPIVVSLKDLDNIIEPKVLGGLILIADADPVDDSFLVSSFKLLQKASAGLRCSGKDNNAFFVTVTRLDGEFGLNGLIPKSYPISAGLAGMAKTAHHEWPEVHCKALDISSNLVDNKQTAAMITNEIFTYGTVEVGLSGKGRTSLHLKSQPILQTEVVSLIGSKDVIVITGGARGVTANVSIALAKAFKPIIVLIGRSRFSEHEPEWTASITNDYDIKKAILAHAEGKITPKDVEKQYKTLKTNREISTNIKRIKEAGAQVLYYSADVRSATELETVVLDIRKQFGSIAGFIHGAGVLADRLIEEKTADQFKTVLTTKVAGLINMLNLLNEDELKFIALFSSFTGRYGRVGQIDYAAANEVLNKVAQQQARLRPSCRVVSVNWGPWNGGMVTPSLKTIFENENVELIDPDTGANYLIQELCVKSETPVEVVIMGGNGNPPEYSGKGKNIELETEFAPAFEIELNTTQYPFLLSHVIDNRAVLPMAMIIEWSAQAAMHATPGLSFAGFNDMRILKGVTLDVPETQKLTFCTGKGVKENDFYAVPVELHGIDKNGKTIVHSRAKILLAEMLSNHKQIEHSNIEGKYKHSEFTIYKYILFHGKDFQGIKRVEHYNENGISAYVNSAPTPLDWIKSPFRNRWLADPLVFDCGFQLMILWCFEKYQSGSLPCYAGEYRQYKRVFPSDGVRIEIHVIKSDKNTAIADIDFFDNDNTCVAQIKNYESIISPSLNRSFRENRLQVETILT